jgi:hypothetical protein
VQYTTHYNLNKPDPNDTYNKANDNSNMDAIDTQMYNNAQVAAAAQTAANNAQTTASAAQATANAAIPTTEIGAANGVAGLDANKQVPANQLGNVPSVPAASESTAGVVKTTGTSGVAVTTDTEGVANGVATTDANNKVVQIANQSDKLSTARTISLSGDATGSASFDGSANENISVTVSHASNADKLGDQLPSYYATASQANSTASGTWTPASGTFNVPAGTVINITAVPSGAKMYMAMWAGGQTDIAAYHFQNALGISSANGSSWVSTNTYDTNGNYSTVQAGNAGSVSATNAVGGYLYWYDGTYSITGFLQINNGYLQFVTQSNGVTSPNPKNTIRWAVS